MSASSDGDLAALWQRNQRGEVTACPCIALNIYLDETDHAQILSFYEQALQVLGPHLTHYLAEQMRQPAKITPRALGMLPTWLRKPKEAHDYRIFFWGDATTDVSPWSLEISFVDLPFDLARRARFPRFLAEREAKSRYRQAEVLGTVLRVTVPVDSDQARPEAWIPWVLALDIIKQGWFVTAESGHSLTTRGDIADQGFMRAMCSRYPGLDWFDMDQRKFLQRYDATLDGVLFQAKRAAWLTFLHESAVRLLGGNDKIRDGLADEPAIVLHPLKHGLGIQAGPRPELGDLSRHDIPIHQRRVARLIRPVRLRGMPLAYEEEFIRHWFNMFDEDHAEGPPS